MQNFSFHNPTAIHFGTGAIAQLSQRVPINARVLVLYGGSSAERNGTLAEVREALHGYQLQEFGGIEPNPSYETLIQAVEKVRSEDLDFLLAVGARWIRCRPANSPTGWRTPSPMSWSNT